MQFIQAMFFFQDSKGKIYTVVWIDTSHGSVRDQYLVNVFSGSILVGNHSLYTKGEEIIPTLEVSKKLIEQ